MITIFSCFIIIVLGIWLFLSILAQFRDIKVIKWIKDSDPFALLPAWTFFAPIPGVADYKLLYRDKLLDGKYTKWIKIPYRDHSIWHSILNPDKRRQKAIADCCISLLQISIKNPKDKSILLSFPYLFILNYIMSMPKNPLCEYRQFSIIRTFGYLSDKQPDLLFTSCLHD